jgi:hypothetical protein
MAATDLSSQISRYAALLVPHWVLREPSCLWTAESSFNERGAAVGIPEDQGSSEMVLVATGNQGSGRRLRLRGHTAGNPGSSGGAGIVWRNEASPAESYRGRDAPTVLTYHEFIHWTDGTAGGTVLTANPRAITLPDETVVAAYQRHYGLSPNYAVSVSIRNPSTDTWDSPINVYDNGTTSFAFSPYPCPLRLPNGRLLLFHWIRGSTATSAQIRMHFSDDNGATWSTGSKYVLPAALSVTGASGAGTAGYTSVNRIRVAYLDGQVCLVASLKQANTTPLQRDVFLQYVSDDLGATFRQVGSATDWDGSTGKGGALHELLLVNGRIMLLYLEGEGLGLTPPKWRSIGAASEAFIEAEKQDVNTPDSGWSLGWYDFTFTAGPTNISITDGDFAALQDQDGTIYFYGRNAYTGVGGLNQIVPGHSLDGGVTWDRLGSSSVNDGLVWNSNDASTYLKNYCVTTCQGRVLLLHNHAASPGNEDNSLGAAYLGGASTLTMPNLDGQRTLKNQVTYTRNWLPLDLPGDCGWTAAGAGTETLTSGGLEISTAGAARSYSRNPSGAVADGAMVRVRLDVVTGGLLAGDEIAVRLRLADGTDDYDVSVRFTTLGYAVFDNNNGGAQVGASQTVAMSSIGEVKIGMDNGAVRTWHRVASSSASDRSWTVGVASTSIVNDTATPNANNLLAWGQIASGTFSSIWYEVHECFGTYTGEGWADGQANPDDLFPLRVGVTPSYVDNGVSIYALSGPLFVGETWHLDARADYEIERLWPSVKRSPREGWRSDTDAQQTIALALDPTLLGTDKGMLGSDVLGVALLGINFRTFSIEGYTPGSGWSTLASCDASEGMTGLRFDREGSQVTPATTTEGSTTPYLIRQELVGGTLTLDGSTIRRIVANTGGLWSSAQTTRKPVLHLADVEAGDPTFSLIGRIWAPNVTVVIQLKGAHYAGYRLKIPSQSTVEGYFTIGKMVVGPIVALSGGPANGISYTLEAGTAVEEASDRTEGAREDAPSRRIIELPFTDLYPTYRLLAASPNEPAYWKGTTALGGQPIALQHEIPSEVPGLLAQVAGARDPVVLLPAVTRQSASDAELLNRQPLMLYGRMAPRFRQEQVSGEPWQSETFRGDTLAFTEIP